jgi:monoterpene epsilon-lactone hydrolase
MPIGHERGAQSASPTRAAVVIISDDPMAEDRGRVLAFPEAPDAIELRHMRAFVAVAEELNFGRAAERLYITQPALSRQIRTLEQLVGCELLRRSTHRVELTLAGEALLERARRLLREVDEAVASVQSIGGELIARIAQLWQPVAAQSGPGANLEAQRAAYEEVMAQFTPPAGIQVRAVNAGGVPCLHVGMRLDQPPTILYLHGGGYVLGSAFGYRPLAGALALAADASVLVVDYRLAPEHPFPAAQDDALAAYRWMLARDVAPLDITVAGDSCGGGLGIGLMVRLKHEKLPLPGAGLMLCPGVDPTLSMLPEPADEPTRQVIQYARRVSAAYVGDHALDDPLLDPFHADLSGLPPLLIQSAVGDVIGADAHLLAVRARAHGVDVRLDLYPIDAHVFQLFWSFLPEAMDALETAGTFARGVATQGTAAAG